MAISEKFKELIVYVAQQGAGDPTFGATKLNKILFAVDFTAFRDFGQSVSGQTYQKLEFGPAPKHLLPAVRSLESNGAVAWATGLYKLKRLVALRSADLSSFRAEEIDLVHSVIADLSGANAAEVSRLSHDFIGWKAAEMGETIAYETVFVVNDPAAIPYSVAEIEYAKQLAGRSAESLENVR